MGCNKFRCRCLRVPQWGGGGDDCERERRRGSSLSENLKNVIRNDNIIWDVVKSLTPEQVFETNKYFNMISTRLFKLFGFDNKNIKSIDLRDEIIKTLDIIKSEPENIYEIEDDPNKSGLTVNETDIPHSDGSPSDFKYKVDDNSLYIENKAIFVRHKKLV